MESHKSHLALMIYNTPPITVTIVPHHKCNQFGCIFLTNITSDQAHTIEHGI
jgi:hypothetical protein